MSKRQKRNMAYGPGNGLWELSPVPIITNRAPTTNDKEEIGTLWVDQPNDDTYVLTSVRANVATWINAGGGTGTFNALTVTTTATIGTTLTVSGLGTGVVQSSAAGLLSSSAGTDGQLLVADTGGSPVWAAITSATLVITPGAGTLNIEESGGTANSYVTDVGGPIAPLAGVTNILGGANITTDGSVANTISFGLDATITLAGAVTAGVDLTMSSGDCTISADTNAAQTIYLHADGGSNETIDIHSDQGTGVNSLNLHSDVGGVTIASGLASADAINITASDAAGGIDVDAGTGGIAVDTTGACAISNSGAAADITLASAAGSVNITAAEAVANAIVLDATNAAGGIDCDAGTGGFSVVSANGTIEFESGTAAINVGADAVAKTVTIGNITGATSVVLDVGTGALNLGTSATAHTSTLGSVTGAAATVVQSGTGDVVITSTDAITADCAGVLELNSSAGAISIANDVVAQAVNIATGGDRTIIIGSGTGANTVTIECGTGGSNFGTTANAHTSTLGSVNTTSSTVIQSGTGDLIATSTDAITLDSVGVLELNSSAGVISIGDDAIDQAINIGTGGDRAIIIGSGTGANTLAVECGTGGASFGATAVAHTTVLGSATGASATDIRGGTGGITLTAAGIVDIVPATATVAGIALTIDANVGVGTFTGQVTASAATVTLTITNSVCTVGSAILASVSNLGANDARLHITRIIPGAGSFTVSLLNGGTAALNGNILLTFFILAA